jgi:hypothetical protein
MLKHGRTNKSELFGMVVGFLGTTVTIYRFVTVYRRDRKNVSEKMKEGIDKIEVLKDRIIELEDKIDNNGTNQSILKVLEVIENQNIELLKTDEEKVTAAMKLKEARIAMDERLATFDKRMAATKKNKKIDQVEEEKSSN